ncbi:hypothetical protein ACFQQB_52670 [Nonomuraea rubra]|uniref:hypothetical protein n=1 Tax=Nonomuraea rubra TaxID=46180 RepID=UPI00361B670D
MHLWGDAIADGTATDWASPRRRDGVDTFGAYWRVPLKNAELPSTTSFTAATPRIPAPTSTSRPPCSRRRTPCPARRPSTRPGPRPRTGSSCITAARTGTMTAGGCTCGEAPRSPPTGPRRCRRYAPTASGPCSRCRSPRGRRA